MQLNNALKQILLTFNDKGNRINITISMNSFREKMETSNGILFITFYSSRLDLYMSHNLCFSSERDIIIWRSRYCNTVNARIRVIVIPIVVISMAHLSVTIAGEWNMFCAYNTSRIIDIECRTCEIKHWSRSIILRWISKHALYGTWKSACIASRAHRRELTLKLKASE